MNTRCAIHARLLAVACCTAIACLAPAAAHAGADTPSQADATVADASAPSVIPQQVADWNRVDYRDSRDGRGGDARPLVLRATYRNAELPYDYDLTIGWSYRTRARSRMRQAVEQFGEGAFKPVKRDGRTVYLMQLESGLPPALVLLAGDRGAWLEPECPREQRDTCDLMKIQVDPEQARAALFALYDGIDFDQLDDYYSLPQPDGGADPAQGLAGYAAYLADQTVRFAYPQGWSVREFFGRSGRRRTLVAMSDLAALQPEGRRLGSRELVAAAAADLLEADHALVSVEGHSGDRNGFSERVAKGLGKVLAPAFDNVHVAQKATATSDYAVPAFESELQGVSADGVTLVLRQVVFRPLDGEAYKVVVLRRAQASRQTRAAIAQLIDSVRVTARE